MKQVVSTNKGSEITQTSSCDHRCWLVFQFTRPIVEVGIRFSAAKAIGHGEVVRPEEHDGDLRSAAAPLLPCC